MKNEHMILYERDHQILLNDRWLNDAIVNAAQSLLKQQFHTAGLLDVCALQTLAVDIQHHSEFVQVLHNGSNHWLTVSNIGADEGEVYIYDSMYCSTTSAVKNAIAALLFSKLPKINLKFIDVQMQSGMTDCGLFAITFATALCHGEQPGQFLYSQELMRPHLLKCLEKQKISMFPIQRERRSKCRTKSTSSFPIFCTCRLPPLPNVDMIQCRSCKEWYHVRACVSVPDKIMANAKAQWNCCSC